MNNVDYNDVSDIQAFICFSSVYSLQQTRMLVTCEGSTASSPGGYRGKVALDPWFLHKGACDSPIRKRNWIHNHHEGGAVEPKGR